MQTSRFSFAVCGSVASVAIAARAARAAPIDGRVRLDLDSNFLSYETFELKGDGASASGSDTQLGLGASGYGLGVGYGVSDSFLLEGHLLFAHEKQNRDGGDSVSSSSFSLLAVPEYVFDGDELRPFVGVGVGHRSTSSDSGDGDSSSSLTFIGPAAGLHAFIADSFSIDPSAAVYYQTGSVSSAGTDLDRSGFAFVVNVAVSGWLGGVAAPEPSAPVAGMRSLPAAAAAKPSVASAAVSEEPSNEGPLERWSDTSARPSATVPLGGADRLVVAPLQGGGEPSVTVLAAETPELVACAELVVSGLRHDVKLNGFTVGSIPSGTETLVALRTTLPLAKIRSLAKVISPLTIEGCGARWEVDYEARQSLRDFVASQATR